jgi:ATP-dependent DNA ligase
METINPMLAKAVATVPAADSVDGGLVYEPKWDGFRGIVSVDAKGTVEIGSRGTKMLTRYFPELVAEFERQLPRSSVLDGEIVVRTGALGTERLDWEALSARIHPAATRIARLSTETPASFVAFDLLMREGDNLQATPFAERRGALEELGSRFTAPLHLSQTTDNADLARRWLEEFEGAGLDGIVAKPLAAVYEQGKRRMLKVKHHRTADVVVLGYRVHASGSGVGSLLLGLYDADGALQNVGGASAFTDVRRRDLVDELDEHVVRDADGATVRGATERSRFTGSKDVSFVQLDATLVAEVRYDQMEGSRFRHTVQFERWRPDREARSCTYEQLDNARAYDLRRVLA